MQGQTDPCHASSNAGIDPFRRTASDPLQGTRRLTARISSTAGESGGAKGKQASAYEDVKPPSSTFPGAVYDASKTSMPHTPTPPKSNRPRTAPYVRARSAGIAPHSAPEGRNATATPSGESTSEIEDIQVVQRLLKPPMTMSVSPRSSARFSSPDALRHRCREMRAETEVGRKLDTDFADASLRAGNSHAATGEMMAHERGRRPSTLSDLDGFKNWQKRRESPDRPAAVASDRFPVENTSPANARLAGSADESAPAERNQGPLQDQEALYQASPSAPDPFRRTASDPGVPRPSNRTTIVASHRRPVPSLHATVKVDKFDRSSSTGGNPSRRDGCKSQEDTTCCDSTKKVLKPRKAQDLAEARSNWTKTVQLRANISELRKTTAQLHAIDSGNMQALTGSLWNKRGRLHQRGIKSPLTAMSKDSDSDQAEQRSLEEARGGAFSRTASAPASGTRLRVSGRVQANVLHPLVKDTTENADSVTGDARRGDLAEEDSRTCPIGEGNCSEDVGRQTGEQIFVSMAIGDWEEAQKKLSALKKQTNGVRNSALAFEDADGNTMMHIAVMPADDFSAQNWDNPAPSGEEFLSPKTAASALGGMLGAMEKKKVKILEESDQVRELRTVSHSSGGLVRKSVAFCL